jgi:hypothetical protein
MMMKKPHMVAPKVKPPTMPDELVVVQPGVEESLVVPPVV